MKKLVLSLMSALFLSFTGIATAVSVSGLYQSVVPVASQSKSLQHTAMQQALSQVFIKASGSSTVVNSPVIQAAIANPEAYLLSYSYQDGILPNGNSSLLLNVSFDPKLLATELNAAQQMLWGQNRPLVLVWLVETPLNGTPTILGSNLADPVKTLMTASAKTRGLPILFPMMDLTDMQAVTSADVTTAQIAPIQQASTRYNSDAILAVNLIQNTDNTWNGSWSLLSQGEETTWQTNNMALDSAIKAGVNAVTDSLAAKFAVASNTAANAEVQLSVMNVNNLTDYAAVTKYLKTLAPVKQVEVIQVQSSALVLDVTLQGGEAALQQSLSLDHHLKPVMPVPTTNNATSTNTETSLVYQWIS